MFKDGIMSSIVEYKNDIKHGLSSRYISNMGEENKCFKTKMGLISCFGHCHLKIHTNLFSTRMFVFYPIETSY